MFSAVTDERERNGTSNLNHLSILGDPKEGEKVSDVVNPGKTPYRKKELSSLCRK